MSFNLIALLVAPLAIVVLLLLLRRSDGAMWRIAELPGLGTGAATRWVLRFGLGRRDTLVLRSIVLTAYLTANVSEVTDFVHELGGRLAGPVEGRKQARSDALHLLPAFWQRPGAIVVIASTAAVADLVSAICMAVVGMGTDALGHLSTPFVMAVIVVSLTHVEEGIRTTSGSTRLGLVIWAIRALAVVALLSLANGTAWTSGSSAAHWIGQAGLAAASSTGLVPLRRWIERGFEGWRTRILPALLTAGSLLGGVATFIELLTFSGPLSTAVAISHIVGAVSLQLASLALALVTADPPRPFTMVGARRG